MNICVFCSASNKIDASYLRTAFHLGVFIAEEGHKLVYGGATGGLMSAIAEGAKSKNGVIVGVIAKPIIKMNRKSYLPTQQIEVETLAERKQKMKEIADLFIVLPGGYGTLDEMFDVLTAGIVREHSKKLILLNENGFYDCFLQLTAKMKEGKFIPEEETYSFHLAHSLEDCKKQVLKYREGEV